MNYKLSFQNETYPVEDVRAPLKSTSTLVQQLVGKPFSFISPIRLAIGQSCKLIGNSIGYQLRVNSCSAFSFSNRYLVSGIIATKEAAMASAS